MKSKNFIVTGGLHTNGKKFILTGPWNASYLEQFDSNSITEIVLNISSGNCDSKIVFLSEFKNVIDLSIHGKVSSGLQSILSLQKLETLLISVPQQEKIDFKCLPNLKRCVIEWWSGANSIFDCIQLKELNIRKITESNLGFLKNLVHLERLTIAQSPIKSLKGIEALKNLLHLELVHLRSLTDFTDIQSCKSLKELGLFSCGKFDDLEILAYLKNLERLTIDGCGNVGSLSPLVDKCNLISITLGGSTNVLDGNLECLMGMERLKTFDFRNRKHYNLRNEDFYKRKWPGQTWINMIV